MGRLIELMFVMNALRRFLTPRTTLTMTLRTVSYAELDVVPGKTFLCCFVSARNEYFLALDSEPERAELRRVKKEKARKKRAEQDAEKNPVHAAPVAPSSAFLSRMLYDMQSDATSYGNVSLRA